MSEQNKFQGDLGLTNTMETQNFGGTSSFREAIPSTSTNVNIAAPPGLPPRPDFSMQQNYGMNQGYNCYGMAGSYGMGGYGGYGGVGSGYGMGGGYGMGMGSMGMGSMVPYGGYNRFGGPMYGDIDSRFVQMAEESSRSTFDSIQGLVNAVGSVAMMLENTFFAMTSSFRAILGVAENFSRIRSLFAQFWSTLAVVRTLNWIVRKLLVMLGIRTECEFKAWAEAVAATQSSTATPEQRARGSSWPALMFFGVVAVAPYIVLKMLSGLTNSINERLHDPTTWVKPLRAVAQHEFQATSPQEISFSANQVLELAPQHLQGHLWNSGWLMATTDKRHAGLIPSNYVKVYMPTNPAPSNTSSTEKVEPNVADLDKYYGQEL